MRKKLIVGALAVCGILSALAALVDDVDAVTNSTKLSDNSSSPQSIHITRTIEGLTNPVTNTFRYEIQGDENNPAEIDMVSSQAIVFDAAIPDEDGKVVGALDFDLSDLEFPVAGEYNFILSEYQSIDGAIRYPTDPSRYTITVVVSNELDEDDFPTGDLTATLVEMAKIGGGKAAVEFSSTAKNTYIEIKKRVAGAAANTEEYFKVAVQIDGTLGEQYTISGLDSTVVYKGEEVNNPTSVTMGSIANIYLKHDQVAVIGMNANGLMEIPINNSYRVSEVIGNDEGYNTTVDGQSVKLAFKSTVASPSNGGNAIAFNANNKTEIINKKEGTGVDTGVVLNAVPFLVLLAVGAVGLLVAKRLSATEKQK